MIGKLERVPLRDVFPHEARSLTKWLLENPDILSEATGRIVQLHEREHSIGSFSADLVGEDGDENIVVVENQLEKSNHDHLGKLLTYVSGKDAKCAIWIVSEARPEHLNAINWLNEAGLCAFYLFRIEAVKIGESDPAPLLTKITGPSEELLAAGQEKKQLAQRHIERTEFWSDLLPQSNKKTSLFANVSSGPYGYLWGASGTSNTGYVYRLTGNDIRVELYFGNPDSEWNRSLFTKFLEHRKQIEDVFGQQLDWDDMGTAKACRIRHILNLGGYKNDRAQWPTIIEQAIDAMVRLEKTTRPLLKTIQQ